MPSIRAIRAADSRSQRDVGCPRCVLTRIVMNGIINAIEEKFDTRCHVSVFRSKIRRKRGTSSRMFSLHQPPDSIYREFVSDVRCSWHLVFSHLQLAASASENISLGRRRVVVGLTAGFSTLHLNFKRRTRKYRRANSVPDATGSKSSNLQPRRGDINNPTMT